MLRIAAEDGITDIVATPHANPRYQYDPALLGERVRTMKRENTASPVIHTGCEVHFSSDNIGLTLEQPSRYTIDGGPYLLVEFPDSHVGRYAESALRQWLDAGTVPIVAHPERTPGIYRNLDRLETWIELGCLVQVTAQSITGEFGDPARAATFRILDRGLVHLVASDAHTSHWRPPVLSKAYDLIRNRYSQDLAELLFRGNPRAVVQGEYLRGGKVLMAVPDRRRWFWVRRRHASASSLTGWDIRK